MIQSVRFQFASSSLAAWLQAVDCLISIFKLAEYQTELNLRTNAYWFYPMQLHHHHQMSILGLWKVKNIKLQLMVIFWNWKLLQIPKIWLGEMNCLIPWKYEKIIFCREMQGWNRKKNKNILISNLQPWNTHTSSQTHKLIQLVCVTTQTN